MGSVWKGTHGSGLGVLLRVDPPPAVVIGEEEEARSKTVTFVMS